MTLLSGMFQVLGMCPPVEQTTQAVQTESQEKATKDLTPLLTPLIDSGTEDVTRFEDETLHQVVKWASSDRIDDSISPDDSVTVEITIDGVATSTAVEVDEIAKINGKRRQIADILHSNRKSSSANRTAVSKFTPAVH